MTVVEHLQQNGIRRVGSAASGFRYRREDGSPVPPKERERIASLVLPPAWTDVAINPAPTAAVQAIGRDRAGRWQYRYAERQEKLREERKRRRLLAFLRALPELRARVARDLRREGLDRERVLAAMVRLLLRGFLRPGSAVYTRENGTYGLCTLRPRHIRVQGRRVTLSYNGKGGRAQVREIDDAPAARVVAALLAEKGPSVFGYRGPDGAWIRVRRRHVNDYLREITGSRFSAKDFRTWAGTLFGACALARRFSAEPATPRVLRRRIAEAMRETAKILGNTPAVCRASYVSPAVLSAFEKGRVLSGALPFDALVRASPRALSVVEHRLARLLRNGHP